MGISLCNIMNIAHNVRIEVFGYDDKEEVKNTLKSILSESAKKAIEGGKLTIQEEPMKAKRAEETDITIFRLYLEKKGHVKEFVEKLFYELKDENIKEKLCKRIDEECKCYIRLDRTRLLNGQYKLTFAGDCFHIKIALAAYPAKRNKGEKLVCDFVEKIVEK
ncbi:MAG: RNA-binding domain-containing protein [Nanoarchaeota archaeon]